MYRKLVWYNGKQNSIGSVATTIFLYTHTGEYPYNCEICNRRFKDKFKFQDEHNKKYHPDIYAAFQLEEQQKKLEQQAKFDKILTKSTLF